MTPFALAIRDEVVENAKSSPKTSGETESEQELPEIQTHTVDLQLLVSLVLRGHILFMRD